MLSVGAFIHCPHSVQCTFFGFNVLANNSVKSIYFFCLFKSTLEPDASERFSHIVYTFWFYVFFYDVIARALWISVIKTASKLWVWIVWTCESNGTSDMLSNMFSGIPIRCLLKFAIYFIIIFSLLARTSQTYRTASRINSTVWENLTSKKLSEQIDKKACHWRI